MLQMLQKIQNQRVHILNLGFESDWILKSFEKSRPDKLYLIQKDKEDKKAEAVEEDIKKFSKKNKIGIKMIKNNEDFYLLVNQLKQVFEEEKGNNLYLAISSGPRHNTSAFIVSSMLFGKYAKEVYLYSLKDGNFVELPHFEVKLPKKEVIEAIKFISYNEKGCKKKELRDYMFKEKHLEIGKCKDVEHTQYVKLSRAVLDSAQYEWGLIKREGNKNGKRSRDR